MLIHAAAPASECEPHRARTPRLLKSHPELRALVGHAPSTALWIGLYAALQLGIAAWAAGPSWPLVLTAAYAAGAVLSLGLWTLVHETSHDLVFRSPAANRWLGIAAGLPLAIPAASTFRKYHLLHHRHHGDPVLDADIPSGWETRWVGACPFRKALWLAAAPLLQSLRVARMKEVRLVDRWSMANLALQLAFDAAVVLTLGWQALAYLLLSNLFALGLHPLGARWIQEHHLVQPGQETYSYYGPMNRLVFNAGYHNEHHDLMRVPWMRLPQVRAAAPEFYEPLYAHRSWTRLLVRFLTDPQLRLSCRVLRPRRTGRKAA